MIKNILPPIFGLTIFVFALLIGALHTADAFENYPPAYHSIVGKTKKDVLALLKKDTLHSHRSQGDNQWMTFLNNTNHINTHFITVHFHNETALEWSINDRKEIVKEYLEEFASGNILGYYINIRTALQSAMEKLPHDVFISITSRNRPTLFIDVYTTGIARYANALDFTMRENDPPTFQDGFYLIKLGDELEKAADPQAIEGIIFHEIAHRVLNHLHSEREDSCELEKEANRLVKQWGFQEEFSKASAIFGSKKQGDSPCADKQRQP